MTGNLSPFTRSSWFQGLASELDPPVAERRRARARYDDLGRWLQEHASAGDREIQVYPQGSGNLGTTNQDPYTGEFDIDLVLRIEYAKTEVTQQRLNEIVNGWLGSYVSTRQREEHLYAPVSLDKGKRAWTLHYDRFHMDVLPVVPDLGRELLAHGGDPSWLTDKGLRWWQPTNPRGFASWFKSLSEDERVELAKRADVVVDDLPAHGVSTTLQMAVRLLKRHRDTMFRADESKLAPPSALITALAAKAYAKGAAPGEDLAGALRRITTRMGEGLERNSSGHLLVSNPSCPRENYADRYEGQTEKMTALRAWLDRVASDVSQIGTVHGAAVVSKRIDESFGDGLGSRVAKRIGQDTAALGRRGLIGSAATGGLRIDTDNPHAEHTFYGDATT